MLRKNIFYTPIFALLGSSILGMESPNHSVAGLAALITETFYEAIKVADTPLEVQSVERDRLLLEFQKIWTHYFLDHATDKEIPDKIMDSPETFNNYLVKELSKKSFRRLREIERALESKKLSIQKED